MSIDPLANGGIFSVGEVVTLTFTANGSGLPGSYRVLWPDGTIQSGTISDGEIVSLNHTFIDPGSGDITVRVTEPDLTQVSDSVAITIV